MGILLTSVFLLHSARLPAALKDNGARLVFIFDFWIHF